MVSRRAIIGGTGAVLLAGLGYRICDRGVFSGASGEAYAPWADWQGSKADGARRPLHAAILAANPHDTQPWLFGASDNSITVIADRARNLGAFDPFRREMHLGLGCAIENLSLAAWAMGKFAYMKLTEGRLTLSPPNTPAKVAQIKLGSATMCDVEPMCGKIETTMRSLYEAISHRHTNRGPYREDQPIAQERLQQFADLANSDDVHVVFITDRRARAEMGALIVEATERIITDPQMSADSYHWIRTGAREVTANPSGITIDASGVPQWLVMASKVLPDLDAATTDQYWLGMTRETHVATAPVLGIILVKDRLDMRQSIEAGRAWQRLHLAATVSGIAAQPLNQPVECVDRNQMLGRPDTYASALSKFANMPGWEATFVFRLGTGVRAAGPSPRRPLADVLRI